jgi:peptidase E
VANLLVVWRLHGVDTAMAEAWEKGVVLGGVSAGSVCWHVGGTTDSFGPTLRPVTDGLGLLPFGNGVHFNSEAQRRPLLHELVGSGVLPEVCYATDDTVGVLYEGTEPIRIVADMDVDPDTGPAAYRVRREGGRVIEERLPVGKPLG